MNFSDIFGDIFGDIFSGGRAGPQRGADLRYHLEISLEQAVLGTTVEVTIPTQVHCSECGGSGARKGALPVTCNDCGGYGQIRIQQGFFSGREIVSHSGFVQMSGAIQFVASVLLANPSHLSSGR